MLKEEEYTLYTNKCLTNKNFLNDLIETLNIGKLWLPDNFEIINYITKFNLPTGNSLKIILLELFNNQEKNIYLKILKQYNDLRRELSLNVFSEVISELRKNNENKIIKIKNFFFSPYQSQEKLNNHLKKL